LAISRRFMEMMDGHISVETELGAGSCFTVWLPDENRDRQTKSRENAVQRRLSLAARGPHFYSSAFTNSLYLTAFHPLAPTRQIALT
jgi:hypothetical protein